MISYTCWPKYSAEMCIRDSNVPNPDDVLDVLSKLGGFDIAGLCGMFLGGALAGVPVLMDGFISGVAALCAVRLCPAASKAVFASHCSTEPAARLVLEALGKTPLLTAGLHLGEGTGAVASIPLWDMALAVYEAVSYTHLDVYKRQALTALALCAGVLTGCGGAASGTASSVAASSAASSEASGADADALAAQNVADLIDAIYVQQRTDDTDAQCDAAKAEWDALTCLLYTRCV